MTIDDISGINEDTSGTTEDTSGTTEDTSEQKTHAEKMLEAIEAVLEGRLLDEYKTLKIANREITKHTFDELRRFRDYYRAEVVRQKVRKNGKFKNYRYRF